MGPVLAAHFRASTNVPANLLYVDPVAAFITALLPALKDKVDSLLVEISGEPQYLSKFMGQLMDFDDEVRSRFHYDAGEINSGWKGLTWDVLDDWFDRWISIEERFALERYEQIIAGPDSGLIDYDSNESGKSKPTFGAIQISDLLRTVTAQYCRLRKFSHKLRFLMQAQLNVLDRYGLRLRESLEAYVSLTSPVGRTLKGYTKEEQMAVEGLAGLERLSRVYGSADHIISTLEDFCNDEVRECNLDTRTVTNPSSSSLFCMMNLKPEPKLPIRKQILQGPSAFKMSRSLPHPTSTQTRMVLFSMSRCRVSKGLELKLKVLLLTQSSMPFQVLCDLILPNPSG